jgi:hypothetical protein
MSDINEQDVNVDNDKSVTVGSVPVAATQESDLSKVLSKLLLQQEDAKKEPEVTELEPYIWEQGSMKMVYMPFDMRQYLFQIDHIEDLIEPDSIYKDERMVRLSAAIRKNIQRDSSILGSAMFNKQAQLRAYFESNGVVEEFDEPFEGEALEKLNFYKPKVFKILDELEIHFKAQFAKLREGGQDTEINFDELLTILNTPNLLLTFDDPWGSVVAFTSKSASVQKTYSGIFCMGIGTVHVARQGIVPVPYSYKIAMFRGKKSFKDLGIADLTNDNAAKDRLKERGELYHRLTSSPSYAHVDGYVTRRKWYGNNQFRARGRVMVDYNAMKAMDDEYEMFFAYNRYENGDVDPVSEVTDQVLMTCAPYVYGFSLTAKKWGEFRLEEVSDIVFRDDAFESVVMDPEIKHLVLALVDAPEDSKKDLIDGKGGGTIFLLEGEPGVGKTLLAESTAELLHRPLYTVGVGELGTDADQLEERLRKILEVCTSWNAVLLLDEADIFMEQRQANDIIRNAMVGVFLRLLEYYEGILFLTSNRAKNMDRAFFSRISMAIHFDDLTADDRETIWGRRLNLMGVKTLSAYDVEGLAEADLNGRQIKNVIRNAMSLAAYEKREVGIDDFDLVIDKGVEFKESLHREATPEAMGVEMEPEAEEISLFQRISRAIGSFFNTLGV